MLILHSVQDDRLKVTVSLDFALALGSVLALFVAVSLCYTGFPNLGGAAYIQL
jgi:hypothetical protein